MVKFMVSAQCLLDTVVRKSWSIVLLPWKVPNLVWSWKLSRVRPDQYCRGSPRTTHLHRQAFPAWTGNTFMDWAQVSWLFSHLKHGHPDWWVYRVISLKFRKWPETDRKMKIHPERYPREQRAEPWHRMIGNKNFSSSSSLNQNFQVLPYSKQRDCQLILCFSPLRFLGLTWWSSD